MSHGMSHRVGNGGAPELDRWTAPVVAMLGILLYV
jgi:hypothetical protein